MIYNVYSLRDLKTGFMGLTLDMNDPAAMRNFAHAMHNKESLMNTHPQDFTLYRLGKYDTETGVITVTDKEVILEGYNVEL